MKIEFTVNTFICDKFFRIPIYQRSYVWTEKNWEALWQDILDVTSEKYHKHFIGSIIYTEEEDGIYLVIDGQQRLTTFTLFVAAACYFLSQKQGELAKRELQKLKECYLFKEKDDSKEPVLRLRPADANEKFFSDILDPLRLGNSLTGKFDSKESQIFSAFNYFQNKIERYSNNNSASNKNSEERQVEVVAHLIESAFQKITLIPIELGDDDDAQRVFECMNHRGQALEQSDLIRNYVLQGWVHEKRSQFYDNYWIKIEEAAKDSYARKKIDEDKVPEFFRHFLSMRENEYVKERDIFDKFKTGRKYNCTENGKRSPDKMERILREMRRFAGYYGRILNSLKTNANKDFDKSVLRHLWYINQLPQASTVYPFLLQLLDDYVECQIIDKDTLIDSLEVVQSYIVRCTFCYSERKSFSKIFSSLYRRAFSKSKSWGSQAGRQTGKQKTGIAPKDYIECIQRGLGTRTQGEMFPTNEDLKNFYQTFNLYQNRAFCKYILLRLEEEMHCKKDDTVPNEEKLTIEHIYPQNPGEKWKGIENGGLTQTLGNLTLTTQNSEMSNLSFAEKIEKGFRKSNLKLNKYLADLGKGTEWNEVQIRKRANELYKEILKVWQDIPARCRGEFEQEEIPIRDLDVDDFLNSEFWRNKKPAKIDHITFGTRKIFGQKYPGRKSWKGNENESSPPKDSPDGQFYNDIMQCLYEGHESTFEDTPLGKTVELEKRYNSESLFEREYTYFVVPQEIIEEPNGKFAIQTDYSKMWQNIKRAAEETGALEKLLIGFAG